MWPDTLARGLRLLWVHSLLLAAAAAGASAQPAQDPLGTKDVIVAVGRYPGTNPPQVSARDWQRILDHHVNLYYRDASGHRGNAGLVNQTTWRFRSPDEFGLPQVFDLQTAYDDPPQFLQDFGATRENDPRTLFREGWEALRILDTANPAVLEEPGLRRLILIVNQWKRGIAFTALPYVTVKNQVITVSVTVLPEPPGVVVDGLTLRVASSSGEIGVSADVVSTVCHELGHILGLPDLYREPVGSGLATPGPEFNDNWCEMAADNRQNFAGFCRQMTGWIGPERMEVVAPPATGGRVEIERVVRLPMTGVGNQRELFFLPTTEDLRNFSPSATGLLRGLSETFTISAPPFVGYLIEARRKSGRDRVLAFEPESSLPFMKFFISQDATGAEIRSHERSPLGLPGSYEEGVLISFTKPWLPGLRLPPFHPVEVVPRRSRTDEPILRSAPFGVGDAYEDVGRGLTVRVLERVGDTGYRFRVTWEPPPLPDVAAADIWLDNPANGFGTYFTDFLGRDAGAPKFFGDPVFRPASLRWSGLVPIVELGTADHRLHVRIRNQGAASLAAPTARVVVLEPQVVPLGMLMPGPDFFDRLRAALTLLNPVQVFELGQGASAWTTPGGGADPFPLAPGAVAEARVTWRPSAPFVAVLVVEPARAADAAKTPEPVEYWTSNLYSEAFLVPQVAPGSPYPAFDVALGLANVDKTSRVLTVTPTGVPRTPPTRPGNRRWNGEFTPGFAALASGKKDTFTLKLKPPDPAEAKPPQLQTIRMIGWMNYLDTMVPVGEAPVHVALSFGTRVTASVDAKGRLTGKLEVRGIDGKHTSAPAGLPLLLVGSGSDGTSFGFAPGDPNHTAITDAKGNFSQDLTKGSNLKKDAKCAVVAQFGGSADYQASQTTALPFTGPK
ncbi:MAG: hypothetical protein HYZ53_26770 [Planctomycetes bacterium]|nr:hypothetical protein [Planctomycetota bacterium]